MKPKTKIKSTPPAAPPPAAEVAAPKVRFTFRVTVHETTRLRVGDVIPFQGREHVVCDVSESCARVLDENYDTHDSYQRGVELLKVV